MAVSNYEESELYKIRHTAAHVLAMAALEWDPKAKLAIGPPIENGFYYDFQFSKTLTETDLPILEKAMQRIINADFPVKQKYIERKTALSQIKKDQQVYKKELIDNLSDEKLSFYGIDSFWDLCKGPHTESTGKIKAFKLLSVAGAYWRGDEHQPMLTRVYATAFESKKELDTYLQALEEAKKRDHKKLGPSLDLFIFSDLVGPGLPLWTPKGTIVRDLLDNFVWELRREKGYEKVEIPHITKKELYEKSGHWEKFKDDLYIIETREGKQFAVKPMNCPHHTQIFKRKLWSYREMPQRYANTTMVYRDEQSGELSGLSRVISITQDDAHVFCRSDQVVEELLAVWDIVEKFYGRFGFTLRVRLSFHDPKTPEKYLGDPAVWKVAESELLKIAKQKKANYFTAEGEANFYGPKIDFMASDSLGREWQVATIQLDMNLPKRFELSFVNAEGKEEEVVMIHAAIMGSIERFMSVLIEHYAGEFPFWLAPVQTKIVTVSEKVEKYGNEVLETIENLGYRVEFDQTQETLGKKIRRAEMEKVPLVLVLGEKEAENKTVTVRLRTTAEQQTIKLSEITTFLEKLAQSHKR